jgi:16S rRNA G527 N7-methylase RsmG
MAGKAKKSAKTISKPCEDCTYYQEITQKLKVSEVLARAIAKFEERIREADFSPSVGDYIKLVQMKKELEEATDEAKEIKVTWVEPVTSDSEK